MKKMMVMLAVGAVAFSASAGLTEFKWGAGVAGDALAGEIVTTFVGTVPALDIIQPGNTVDIADLVGFVNQQTVVLVPFGPAAGQWGTGFISDATSARVGLSALAILDNDGVFSVGETVKFGVVAGTLSELDTVPPGTPQTFAPGSVVSVQVIPEPATLGLMGVAGLGLFLARRKARR